MSGDQKALADSLRLALNIGASFQISREKVHIALNALESVDRLTIEKDSLEAEVKSFYELLEYVEGFLTALHEATDYIKPGTGVWHGIGLAKLVIDKILDTRKEGTP